MAEGVDRLSFLHILLSHLDHCGRVFGESQHINTSGNQRLGGLARRGRVVPLEQPAHVHGGFGVYFPHSEGKGVDVPHYLGDRVGRHIADFPCLGQRARHQAVQVVELVKVSHVVARVRRTHEAGAVEKQRVRVLCGGGEGAVHEPETRGKEHVTLFFHHEPVQEAVSIGLGHGFGVGCLQPIELSFDVQATLVVGVSPPIVANRPHVDVAGLHSRCGSLLRRRFRGGRGGTGGQYQGRDDQNTHQVPQMLRHSSPPFIIENPKFPVSQRSERFSDIHHLLSDADTDTDTTQIKCSTITTLWQPRYIPVGMPRKIVSSLNLFSR